ncbi:MAG: TonB-dependent receptor [Chlorobi bacterium]|nr:TonB-dependent receptor [Chlorobiota bacterium]
MIFRTLLLINILLLFNYSAFGQAKSISEINGTILNQENKEAIPYADIRLSDLNDSLISGTITSYKGEFKLSDVPEGKYKLLINFIGFERKTINVDVFKKSKIKLGKVYIKPSYETLDEIIVKGDRRRYETLIDKDIFIPDTNMIKSSASAADLLGKVPGLKINRLNNTVAILGSDNTMVLINGQERGGNVNISTIKPRDIDKIEIIKSPSSKYNGEYAGIINIILKKKIISGFSLTLAPDYYGKMHNESFINAEYGIKKIRFFSNYMFHYRNHPISQIDSLKTQDNKDIYNNVFENKSNKVQELGHLFQYGFDYFINNKNTFNFTGDYKIINVDRTSVASTKTYLNSNLSDEFNTNLQNDGSYLMQNYSFYYKREFQKKDSYFTTDLNYYIMDFIIDKNYTDTYFTEINDNVDITRKQTTNDKKKSVNYKFDYVQRINEKFKFETGYNLYYRKIDDYFTDAKAEYFNYKEIRNSIYYNLYYSNNKIFVTTGFRAENSNNTISDTVNTDKTDLLPNTSILYKFGKQHSLKISYKKYITRPGFRSLKPFIYQTDSLNYYLGNPFLLPATTNKLSLSYNFRNENVNFSTTLYNKMYKDIFGKVVFIEKNIKYTRTSNTGKGTSSGIQFTSSIKILKKLRINPYFDINYQYFSDNGFETEGFSYGFNFSAELSLKNNIFAGTDLGAPGKNYYLQGYRQNKFSINAIYAGKSFSDNKGNILVFVTNPFTDLVTITSEDYNNYERYFESRTKFTMFVIKLSYTFRKGKRTNKLKRKYNMERDM